MPQNPSSPLQVNAGFTGPELHYLKQGIAKVITESRNHVNALLATPANSIDSTEATLIEYYEKRIKQSHALLQRIETMQEELSRKQLSVAHNI